jgi:DNA phosphorothioation-dependent restriction protein DptG
MKYNKLIKEITKRGAKFVRHGAKHDIYENPVTNRSTQVPRHPNVNEMVAKAIIKFFS